LFALVPRHTKVKVKFLDEEGRTWEKTFSGLRAHVIQHEIDHLNGILFVDRVKNIKSFMTYSEYMQRVKHVSKDV
jgi:peptide deformylase